MATERPMGEPPRLLKWWQTVLLILAALVLFAGAGLLIGWKEAFSAVLAGIASLALTLALVEQWLHHRKEMLDELGLTELRSSVARDLFRVAGPPVNCIAQVVLPDYNVRALPSEQTPEHALELANAVTEQLRKGETSAWAHKLLEPWELTDKQLEEVGLVGREGMRRSASNIVMNLKLRAQYLPGRLTDARFGLLNTRFEPELAEPTIELLSDILDRWQELSLQTDNYPTYDTFLSLCSETLLLACRLLHCLNDLPEQIRPSGPKPDEKRLYFTTWDEVKREEEAISRTRHIGDT
jgi:hypothetical protein